MQQNATISKTDPSYPRYELYATYCACGGIMIDDDGTIKKQSVTEFAKSIGVDRVTLHRWKKRDGFWDLVEVKRAEVFQKSRLSAIWNGLTLRAMKGDAKQAEMILSAYAGYQPPSQKHEVKVSGLGDLVNIARNKKIIEGEVVEHGTGQVLERSDSSRPIAIPTTSPDSAGHDDRE
jgi:hypothetical protein